jgi:hypothetical protein
LCHKIAGVKPPNAADIADVACWNLSTDGQFSIKSAYQMLCTNLPNKGHDSLYQKIWNWQGPNSIRAFLRKLAMDGYLLMLKDTKET